MEKPEIKLLPCQREMLNDKERVVLPWGDCIKCHCERTKHTLVFKDKPELKNNEKHLYMAITVNQCCKAHCGIRRNAE